MPHQRKQHTWPRVHKHHACLERFSTDVRSHLHVPAYIPLRRKTKPLVKTVQTWPERALSQLQDCFARTNWEHQDLSEYTQTVLSYISCCTDSATIKKCIRPYLKQKPWMSKDVHALLKTCNMVFRSGDRTLYSIARTDLKRGIKEVKWDYKRKIEEHLTDNNTKQVWQGI